MASPISFQGLSSGLQTDQLVNAILQAESAPLDRLKLKASLNTRRIDAINSLSTGLRSLASAFASLGSLSGVTAFEARTVSSSDATNAYVTAKASGGASGNYDVVVTSVATKARLESSNAVASSNSTSIGQGDYVLTDTNGVSKTITIGATNDNLASLRDAINASGANVSATIIQTAAAGGSYKLVLSANSTGQGTAGGTFTIKGPTGNALGYGDGLTNGNPDPLDVSTSSTASNASFSVNGVALTRTSNTVSDAVTGLTLNLVAGSGGKTTTFTVATDKDAITKAFQGAVTQFNNVVNAYKTASSTGGPLANDSSVRGVLDQVRAVLQGAPAGLSVASGTVRTLNDLGISTKQDGTLSLDTTVLQAALDKDPDAVKRVVAAAGVSTSPNVEFAFTGPKAATGALAFNITSYDGATGAYTGTVNGVAVSGSGGIITGPAGSSIEGLGLKVQGTGSGTITVSRGLGQALQDLVSSLTTAGGGISTLVSATRDRNLQLDRQIADGTTRLQRRQQALKLQFSKMESTLGQLQAAGQSIGGIR